MKTSNFFVFLACISAVSALINGLADGYDPVRTLEVIGFLLLSYLHDIRSSLRQSGR